MATKSSLLRANLPHNPRRVVAPIAGRLLPLRFFRIQDSDSNSRAFLLRWALEGFKFSKLLHLRSIVPAQNGTDNEHRKRRAARFANKYLPARLRAVSTCPEKDYSSRHVACRAVQNISSGRSPLHRTDGRPLKTASTAAFLYSDFHHTYCAALGARA
jgi:hypothetical protein